MFYFESNFSSSLSILSVLFWKGKFYYFLTFLIEVIYFGSFFFFQISLLSKLKWGVLFWKPLFCACSSQPLVLSRLHVGVQSLVPQHEHPAQEHVSHKSTGHAHEEEGQEEGLQELMWGFTDVSVFKEYFKRKAQKGFLNIVSKAG